MFIDTHAHLNDPAIINDLQGILSRAEENGIEKIIIPATNLESSLEITDLIQKHKILYGAVGIHPSEVNTAEEKHLNEIELLCRETKIVAVGEIGLDYYWKPYDKEKQKNILKRQIQIARDNGLPVVIHNRESTDDLMELITEEFANGVIKGQFHSFSGSNETANKCVDMGFFISFTGNITYKPNQRTLEAYEVIKSTPASNLLLETDSPYLPPVPFRGKKNEPSYIKHTAEKIASLKSMGVNELAGITAANAEKLFGFTVY